MTVEQTADSKPMRHLLQITDLDRPMVMRLLAQADTIIHANQHSSKQQSLLAGKTLANLFFEPSTRTRVSFELAAKRLGAEVINFDEQQSSMRKDEALIDTVLSLQAMHCHFFVLRHPKNSVITAVAKQMPAGIAIINAGDGTHAHPSQALLDMFTIQQYKPDFAALTVAIVGDVKHSRVASSQIAILQMLGVKEIRLIGPPALLPSHLSDPRIQFEHNIAYGLQDVDVVIMLRVQKERIAAGQLPNLDTYYHDYGLTQARLAYAKPDAIVMHPGPVNRGIEIDSSICDGPQSVISQQVRNGVAIRMAILLFLVKSMDAPAS